MSARLCLIVDDSRIIRKVARRIVEGLGFDVVEAGDGVEAIEQCIQSMPDLILLDWRMPMMDGMDFLDQLKQMADGDHPKILFCSMETDPAHIARALAAGADDYVMKPFDGDILQSKIDEIGALQTGLGHAA
ncbi:MULTISPECIES: PleD family two-component system response regulator [unclassified Brevundimonas]|uniref:response regulator n=1 Tax=unclassified Brevundimonas TaxID=2622653 RepID=UPI0025BEFF70|nr:MULTISPECIES: response regulator [unclassified Brevundimonas]